MLTSCSRGQLTDMSKTSVGNFIFLNIWWCATSVRSFSVITGHFNESWERGGFIDLKEKCDLRMFSHDQLVTLCHWIHMLGLWQHLFAEQHCDLVMTSGNVSFQQKRSNGLVGVGRGRRGDSQGKGKKGRHKRRNSERGAAPKLFHNPRSSCVDHRRCMGEWRTKFRKLSQVGSFHDEV